MFGTFFVPGLMVKEDLMTTNTMNKDRKKKMETQSPGEVKLKGFLDMIAPSVIQFYTIQLHLPLHNCLQQVYT